MAYLLEAGDYILYITGSAQPKLSQDKLKNFIIPIPDNLTEQQTIANYLDKKCANIDQLISIKQQKADELKEYKKSMIYEYVTGKKEVIQIMEYKPPYTITTKIVNLVAKITECATRLSIREEVDLKLRKAHRIQTIQGSLAIEGNTLSVGQITAILDGKHIVAPIKEIQEVRNAIRAYDRFLDWNPYSVDDLLEAHLTLTEGLIDQSGMFRMGGVGVVADTEVIHVQRQLYRGRPRDCGNYL